MLFASKLLSRITTRREPDMAYCPKCSKPMPQAAAACPICGYGFPLPPDRRFVKIGTFLFAVIVAIIAIIWSGGKPTFIGVGIVTLILLALFQKYMQAK